MEITKNSYGSTLVILPKGRLDTNTAPALQAEVDGMAENITELIFDFHELHYLSSAGLRILLSAHKKMTAKGGSMKITNTNQMIDEIFEVTGFADILTIE